MIQLFRRNSILYFSLFKIYIPIPKSVHYFPLFFLRPLLELHSVILYFFICNDSFFCFCLSCLSFIWNALLFFIASVVCFLKAVFTSFSAVSSVVFFWVSAPFLTLPLPRLVLLYQCHILTVLFYYIRDISVCVFEVMELEEM